ncbi:MAG TPA: leucyl aminopeptidase family protein [Paracoccaceae bacterium]|nr:leucyl aminopeptidase family protein [Paracoccaceae bacterium]
MISSDDPAATGAAGAIPITLVPKGAVEATLGALPAAQAAWARANGFRGRLGQALRLPDAEGRLASVLFGWGDDAARARERFHLGDFARGAPEGTYRLDTPLEADAAEEAALGWRLGRYRFDRYKAGPDNGPAELLPPEGVDARRLDALATGVCLTRDLINTPASDMGPVALEGACRELAARHGAEVAVTAGDDLLGANFPMIHAVGRAGSQPPRLIEMVWGDAAHPKVTLVGKGVCFDTGGLDIKPPASMKLMKKDMGGAATVLGLAHMVMALALPVRLRVLIPAVENSISGNAMRPGDILRSRLGRTVEINNTDAEGRLVLADALALGAEDGPALMLDMATLTGAARVALGPDIAPFFTDDEALAAELFQAGRQAADPLWRLPLWPGYEGDIEPGIADLDNAPAGGMAGSITAALFLKRFAGDAPWAHFDVYGWVPNPRPGRPRGGEAQAARAVLRVLEARFGRGA